MKQEERILDIDLLMTVTAIVATIVGSAVEWTVLPTLFSLRRHWRTVVVACRCCL